MTCFPPPSLHQNWGIHLPHPVHFSWRLLLGTSTPQLPNRSTEGLRACSRQPGQSGRTDTGCASPHPSNAPSSQGWEITIFTSGPQVTGCSEAEGTEDAQLPRPEGTYLSPHPHIHSRPHPHIHSRIFLKVGPQPQSRGMRLWPILFPDLSDTSAVLQNRKTSPAALAEPNTKHRELPWRNIGYFIMNGERDTMLKG